VADANQTAWWVRTGELAVVVLAGFAAVVAAPLLLAGWLDRGALVGLPFGYFVVALAIPIVLALAIFWFADRQRVLDHTYDVVDE
jgi:putative solute:sodium symporter small subunit